MTEFNLIDIKKYIIHKYPNSGLNTCEDIDILSELKEFFLYRHIGICGCGCPEDTIDIIIKYLKLLCIKDMGKRKKSMKDIFGCEYVDEDPLLQFLAYIMDNKNLTDHGSNINWCWLTTLGEMFLYVFTYDES